MTKIFFDTEFTGLHQKTTLISIKNNMQKVIVYKNVFDRNAPFETSFSVYMHTPATIFDVFGVDPVSLETIRNTMDKRERNEIKRTLLPAMDLSQSGILAIDIDGISEDPLLYQRILLRLSQLDTCYVVKESVSGNLVAFFQYDCSVMNYPYLYYKLYLELTLLLGVTIDYLPEIGRLRYVGGPGCLYKNEDARIVTELLKVNTLPKIQTTVTPAQARNIKYGSR